MAVDEQRSAAVSTALKFGRRARGIALDVAVRFALLASDVMLRTLGLERALRCVGARGGWSRSPDPVGPPVEALSRSQLMLVGIIMRRRAIWTRTDGPCLRQALLVSLVVRRHHPVVHLGMKGTDAGPMAHAWVTVGKVRIDYDPSYASFGTVSM
ncbi:MAG: lasso peptide biosynthesis B2 protein [Ilumatobacteraceae bacterium]